ncbi:hypothetical protein TRVA0_001S09582 [Trichomonascus vanleenenianus]|uniref:uncharacterized protein n=1 Tax=Trichomonascus vanleenenianus TaxID=2268995 RepID=UPI003ECB7FB5
MSVHTDVERSIAQVLLSQKVIAVERTKEYWLRLRGQRSLDDPPAKHVNEEYDKWSAVIDRVTESFQLLGMDVKMVRDPVDGTELFIVIIQEDQEYTQVATRLPTDTIEFFKLLLHNLFSEETNSPMDRFFLSIGEMRGIPELKRGRSDAIIESHLKKLTDELWLSEKDGVYTVSIRTLYEMEEFLKENFGPDGTDTLRKCGLCRMYFTSGWQCTTENCSFRSHHYCLDSFDVYDCPECHTNFLQTRKQVGLALTSSDRV